jgi:hypothetical protein
MLLGATVTDLSGQNYDLAAFPQILNDLGGTVHVDKTVGCPGLLLGADVAGCRVGAIILSQPCHTFCCAFRCWRA